MKTLEHTAASNETVPFMHRHALDYMDAELEKLLALAQALVDELEPEDPNDPKDDDKLTAWRLAEVLHERLSDTRFSTTMRDMVLGA